MTIRVLRRTGSVALLLLGLPLCARGEGLVDSLVQQFAQSDFVFTRAASNAPFLPLAWVSATGYERSTFTAPGGAATAVDFRQASISEGALLPVPIGSRDGFIAGEWLQRTSFHLLTPGSRDLEDLSVSVPLGWIHQQTADWQLAAFVAPLGHHSDAEWYWETLGGLFARYIPSERVAWIFGAYFDVSSAQDFYTPYLGATWTLNERWTISAVLPWPGVSYAPDTNTLFRLGVSPSGDSWLLDPRNGHPLASFGGWNLGLDAEKRVYGNFWIGLQLGISGLRGLTIVDEHLESLQTQTHHTGYLS